MSIQERVNEFIREIKVGISTIRSTILEDFIKETQLGKELSFKDGEDTFLKIKALTEKINNIDLGNIPHDVLAEFSSHFNTMVDTLKQIKAFSPAGHNPADTRNSLLNLLEANYYAVYQKAWPVLCIGQVYFDDSEKEKLSLKTKLDEINKTIEVTKKQVDNATEDINKTINLARNLAAKTGVAQYDVIFKSEAEEHKKISKYWLIASIFVLISIIVAGIILLNLQPKSNEAAYLVQHTVTKVVIITTLFYGLSICSRNYKAHKHNSILNKHRQNALTTFEIFSKAAGDDVQTKNAILLEAAHTIFSNQQTGYLNTENDGDSPNKIIEIIKSSSGQGN